MADTLHLHLTHEELKDLLRRRFARAGLEPPILDAIEEIALLIRRHGFTAFLEGLELASQELSGPPCPAIPQPGLSPEDVLAAAREPVF